MSDLNRLAEEARNRRLSGDHHDGGEFPLTGYCFDNAFVVYNVLSENGHNPEIVAGLAERFAEDLLREVSKDDLQTVEDLAGQVHFWVEVDGKIVDIAPELESNLGEVFISDGLPEGYHRLSNSYSYAEDILDSARSRRCYHCGGQTRTCGCGN